MTQTLPVIGVAAEELSWVRMLVFLLRHPNPTVPELARQALLYLREAAEDPIGEPEMDRFDHAG